MSAHPKRRHIHFPSSVGDKVADVAVGGMGSWRFIIIQTIVVLAWIVGNRVIFHNPFDPYPFILLNLLFSTQAAYAAPLILKATNRQAAKDAIRDDTEAVEVDELHEMNKTQLTLLEQQMKIMAQQMEILELLKTLLAKKS